MLRYTQLRCALSNLGRTLLASTWVDNQGQTLVLETTTARVPTSAETTREADAKGHESEAIIWDECPLRMRDIQANKRVTLEQDARA
ncbi:hypothetical protein D7S86_15825 [Pararobbsia silviterrae]|uniref:Uncharacterized protein n=1 Tax=Pararobbsia silviterrae TaxID=1792498 RepID=A0A494XZV3_9BURK|nr:hypothetical protein D7S86_15825 [Pararobbsia silviterrae]